MGRTWLENQWTTHWGSSDKIMPASLVDILNTMTTSDPTRCDDGDASGDINDEGIIYLNEDIDDEPDYSDSD